MKRITSFIISFFAIVLFLASSTGISFVIHHCSDYHSSEFHLYTSDYECEHEKSDICCNITENNVNIEHNCVISKPIKCCSNDKGYFRITDNYNYSRFHLTFNTLFQFEIQVSDIIFNSQFINKYQFSNHSPPLFLCGQEILIQNSQFII